MFTFTIYDRSSYGTGQQIAAAMRLEQALDQIEGFLDPSAKDSDECPVCTSNTNAWNELLVKATVMDSGSLVDEVYVPYRSFCDAVDSESAILHAADISQIGETGRDLELYGKSDKGCIAGCKVRQLTGKGMERLHAWLEGGRLAGGLEKIWNDPVLCPPLEYIEKVYGLQTYEISPEQEDALRGIQEEERS